MSGPAPRPGRRAAPGDGAPDPIFRRILRNAALILTGKAATAVLNLGAFGIAMHSLGAAQMGVLVLVHGFAQTAASFAKFQSWQAVLRFGAGNLAPERRAEFQALLRFTAGWTWPPRWWGARSAPRRPGGSGAISAGRPRWRRSPPSMPPASSSW